MAYATIDDLKKKIDELKLIQLTDVGGSGRVDITTVERAIRDAQAMADSHISPVYKTPLATPPHLIVDIVSSIAVFYLHRFRSIESPVWKEAFLNALTILRKISEGAITLEGATPEPAASGNAASGKFSSDQRSFSRDSLKGM